MICQNCKSELKEDAKFCTVCGKPADYVAPTPEAAAPAPEVQAAPQYQAPAAQAAPQYQAPVAQAAPQYQQAPPQYQQAPVYNNFYGAPKYPVSIGGWIGRSLIPMIPLVGPIIYFIMLFIWAGDKSKEVTFNNWAKAQLVVMLIGLVVGIISIAIFGALIAELFDALEGAFVIGM